jgi:hypothetical protein
VKSNRWLSGIAAVVGIAIAAVIAHQLFVAAWSNHCDPGNSQFNLLKAEAVTNFHPAGELFTWENDGPDNGWTCANPSLSVSYVGSDVKGMYGATITEMADSGWTAIDIGNPASSGFSLFQKDVTGGVRLTAVVIQQTAWVEVDLSAPGLHPGDRGF